MKRAAIALLTVALFAGGAWLLLNLPADDGVPSAPADASPWSCAEPCDRFTIAWGGDTFLGWAAQHQIKKVGKKKVLRHGGPLIAADYSIVNMEAPWTTLQKGEAPDDPKQFYSYNAPPETAADLAGLGVDAVGLANNHTFDRGSQGVIDAIGHAKTAGMIPFGTGATAEEAGAPLLVPTPHGTVGVLAFNDTKLGTVGGGKAGFLLLNQANAEAGLERARSAGAKWIVAFVHWGRNYAPIDKQQPKQAAMLAKAGYDLIVGHGPHVAQPVGVVDDVPVIYSLGNYLFHTKGRYQKIKVASESYTAVTYLGPKGFEAAELRCFEGDNRKTKFRSPPCKPAQRAQLWERLGGLVQERDGVGVVRFPAAD